MTLKIVSNNYFNEVHSVHIDDGVVTIVDIENGEKIPVRQMEAIFPNFYEIIKNSGDTDAILLQLQQSNNDYIWAHVSGAI